MAKRFNVSALPEADQAAYTAWQAKAQALLQGGALPSDLSYVLEHPEYLQQHPELQEAYNTLTGADLPASVKSEVKSQLGDNTNFDWSGGNAGIAKHKGVWSQPETWIQLALGGVVGGAAAAGAFGAGGAAGGAGGAAGGGATGGAAGGGTLSTAAAGAGLEEAGGLAAPSIAGTATGASTVAGTGMSVGSGLTGGGTLATIGRLASKYGTTAGQALSKAGQAEATNRAAKDEFGLRASQLGLQHESLGLQGYEANTSAQQALQNELMGRAKLEMDQRKNDQRNMYLASVAANPTKSPYNTGQLPTLSDAYKKALEQQSGYASENLGKAPTFNSATMAMPTYTPYVQPQWTPPTQAKKGTLEEIATYGAPILSAVGSIYGGK